MTSLQLFDCSTSTKSVSGVNQKKRMDHEDESLVRPPGRAVHDLTRGEDPASSLDEPYTQGPRNARILKTLG